MSSAAQQVAWKEKSLVESMVVRLAQTMVYSMVAWWVAAMVEQLAAPRALQWVEALASSLAAALDSMMAAWWAPKKESQSVEQWVLTTAVPMVVRTVCHSAGRSAALKGETMVGSTGMTKVALWDMMKAVALVV